MTNLELASVSRIIGYWEVRLIDLLLGIRLRMELKALSVRLVKIQRRIRLTTSNKVNNINDHIDISIGHSMAAYDRIDKVETSRMI